MAIHTGQYVCTYGNLIRSAMYIMFLMGTKALCSCPKPDIPLYLLLLCTVFAYWFHNSQKSYPGKSMSCLGTTESHLKYNTLLLQLSFYKKRFKPISQQGHSHQNLSDQVEIISQASTYSDFQIIVVVVHSMHNILQGCRNWPGRHGNCRTKVSCSYIKRAHY